MKKLLFELIVLLSFTSTVIAQFVPPTTIIESDYDFWANSIVGNSTIFYNDTIHTVNMVRPYPPSTTIREVVYSRSASPQGPFEHFSVFGGPSGFPQMDIATTGGIEGKIGVTSETSSKIAIFNGTGFDVKSTPPSPTFVFSNGKIILWSKAEGKIYKSTDLGNTFTVVDSLSRFHPDVIYSPWGFGGEANIVKSKSEQYLAIVGTSLGDGNVYGGIAENRADNVWMIYSTDFGETWDGRRIAADGVPNLVQGYHTSNFAPLFENFGQVDAAIDDSGKIHVAANGYGVVVSGSNVIGNQFPVLYWNSFDDFWISISGIEIDTLSQIINYYPSPLIGQSYPTIETFPSMSSNETSSLLVYWTGPQTNITNQFGFDTSNGFYLTDIYSNWFTDQWISSNSVEYSDNTLNSETFVNAGKDYDANSGFWKSYLTFIEDQSNGISIFGDGTQTLNPLRIAYYEFIFPNVEDENKLDEYALNQNYPNPFNPATTISYRVNTLSKVTLKIFDVLGNEIAKLVDREQTAGEHTVKFSGTNLSSGIYYYQLRAGDFVQTKKMILLK